jgi:hypothetical protein
MLRETANPASFRWADFAEPRLRLASDGKAGPRRAARSSWVAGPFALERRHVDERRPYIRLQGSGLS